MTSDLITRHWALVIASILGTGVFLFVLYRLYGQSARGRLHRHVRLLRTRKQEAAKAQQRLDKASAKLAGLRSRAPSVKPRLVTEADAALQDAQLMKKISDDLVLVAQRHVRDVILEEFPPNRHDVLRNKHL